MIEKWLNKCPHLFIQQNFIACLFCAKYHSGTGGYVSKQYILDVLLSQTPEDQTTQRTLQCSLYTRHFLHLISLILTQPYKSYPHFTDEETGTEKFKELSQRLHTATKS